MPIKRVLLKPEKEKALLNRHPWIFSGAIDQIDEGYTAGELVQVLSSEEEFLGIGFLNPVSQIAVRMLSFEDCEINDAFFEKRIRNAVSLRQCLISDQTNAVRLIHSENDYLPGLTVDRYGDYLAVQIHSAGMDKYRDLIVKVLSEAVPVRGIYEKSEAEWRRLEGLEPHQGVLKGEDPPELITILENGISYGVDLRAGQKTGFFLDQRENRKLVSSWSKGKKVLNCFSYSGGFSISAARGGALSTVSIDSSEPALKTAQKNFELNGMKEPEHRLLRTDVFQYLRQSQETFDLVVLDPPAFCQSKSQVEKSTRAYKDINLFAIKRLTPGGILFTASCSSHISQDLFQKILFAAAKDAGRGLQILTKTGQPADHPLSIYFPEGEYLKACLCRVD